MVRIDSTSAVIIHSNLIHIAMDYPLLWMFAKLKIVTSCKSTER